MQGAQEEDTPLRWMNHFYDPKTGTGLFLYSSAKNWAEQNIRQSLYPKSNQTWQKALDFYVKGNKKEAFIALGHNLHLIEDMAVPAHTRNNIHPFGDPLETWAKNNADGRFNKILATKFDNFEEYFNSLADYSNRYFLSKDTIIVDDLKNANTVMREKGNGKKVKCIEGSDYSNKNFCLVIMEESFFSRSYFIDDSIVHSDYYSLLAPKAISYGAGMIDLFFKEAEKKKAEEAKKSLLDKLKNILSSFLKGAEPIEQNIKSAFEANKKVLENLGEDFKIASDQGGKVLSASISAEDLFKPEPVKAQGKPNNFVSAPPSVAPPIFENEKKKSEAVENIFVEEEIAPLAEDNQPLSVFNPLNFFITPGGDATRPETTITGKPEKISSSSLASFVFSSSKVNSSFEYSLDNSGWVESDDLVNLSGLENGQHSMEARAFDSYRNFDESPAVYDWTIDTIAPTSTVKSLATDYPATGFTVEWESNDDDSKYNVRYKIEDGDWQEWLVATTSLKSIFDISAEEGKDIFFRAQAFDETGNLGEWSSEKKTKIIFPLSGHLVISEFVSRGPGGAWDEFVELYNPTGEAIDLESWKLQTEPAGGGIWTNRTGGSGLPAGAIIASGSYYLLVAKDYSLSRLPDYRHSANWGLADGGGHIRIINSLDEEIDRVGYGDAIDPEGSSFNADLSDSSSLERKAVYNSSAVSMTGGSDQWQGNGYDQDNNSNDFVLRNAPQPQNYFSPSEPRASGPSVPGDINNLSVVSASSTSSTIKLSWASPNNASSSSGSYYDLRYKIKSGDCDLGIDWDSATEVATSSLPTPAVAGETQEYAVNGLAGDTEYCFAIMVYNGEYWSNLSNQVYEKTLVAPLVDIAIGNTSSLISSSGTSTLSWLHTVEAGDEMLFVSAYWSDNNKDVISAKFAGVSLTKITGGSIIGAKTNVSTWYLINPPVGSYKIEFKFTASMRMAAAAINLSNINTDNPISTSSHHNAQGVHVVDTINVGNNNSLIIDSASVASGSGSLTADAGQTETFNYRFSYFDGTQIGLSYKEADTAGDYESGWTQTNNNNWTHILTVINPKP